ncbi:MAG: fatty acid--CoA ligase family protein [Pseudomonadota bacterium]
MVQQNFQIHPAAALLAPETPSLRQLWQAISEGRSLFARQAGGLRVSDTPGTGPWLLCETSGSTGAPKVIRRRPASWIASFDVNKRLFDVAIGARFGVLGSLGHSLGLYAALEALHLGAGLLLLSEKRPDAQARNIRDQGITHIYATPSQLRLLMSHDTGLFPTLAQVICGGGALSSDLRATLVERCPNAVITEFFGASETSFMAISDAHTPPGAVGRAYPGVDLRVDGRHSDQDIGEIWVKSPYLFDGYEVGQSAETRWDDGFLAIGELGRLDAAGYLHLCGRRDRMVTVADHNVYPEAIEAVLIAQPGVEATAVLNLPDPLRGNRIVAAVQGPATAADLRRACFAALGAHAVPKVFRTVEALPMLQAGKPDLQQLRALWGAEPKR